MKKIIMGILWFFIFQLVIGFIWGFFMLGSPSNKFDPLVLLVSLISFGLVIWGTVKGKLPGTK